MDAKRKALALEDMAAHAAVPVLEAKGRIKVVSHFDCDGIAAAAVIHRTLTLLKKDFEVSFVKNLGKEELRELYLEKNALVLFLDVGSGQLGMIRDVRFDSPVVVCDHHPPEEACFSGLYHMNPTFCKIDGEREISGSGMAYMLSRKLSLRTKDLIWLAIVGAAGDRQYEGDEFFGMNKIFLEEAEYTGALRFDRGLKLFGRYTRPLHKALEFSYEPMIENVSGDESGAVQFLSELGIPVVDRNGKFRKLADLTIVEEKKLATALAVENVFAGGDAADVIGKIYRLKNDYDVREFATVLNACGRIEKPFLGVAMCRGEADDFERVMGEYRKKIGVAVAWCKKNRKKFVVRERVAFVDAGGNIDENIIGTIVPLIMRSVVKKDIVFGFARCPDGVKVSARANKGVSFDLGQIVRVAVDEIGGDARGGGHASAAGAVIPAGSVEAFIGIVEEEIENIRIDS